MRKILSICLALALALCGVGALAEETSLQEQLDAANAKIEELQAQVDTYYPYYAAQIVATYGEDGVVWLDDVQAQYDEVNAQYANYGISLADYGMEDSVKKDIVDSAVESAVLLDKAAELGLDVLDEATQAELEASAASMMEEYNNYYIQYYYADAEEVTDEMTEEAEKYWDSVGMNYETCLDSLTTQAIYDAVYDSVIADVAVTEEEVQSTYDSMVETAKSSYTEDTAYNGDRTSGVAIAWNPEGYRAVKHVLIKFDDDQATLYSDLQSQLDSLNEEKDAIENPTEESETDADTTETEAAEPRTLDEVNADIAACATELEALYAQLMPTAEEVVAAFNSGTSFDELIEKYNEDPGMQSEPTASIGYAVAEGSTYWEQAFTDGAMSIANKGEISAPVYGSNGIHIIYYMDDIPAGEVALDEIRADVEADALSAKQQTTYDDQVAAWVEAANVEYFYSNFGIAETTDETTDAE